MSRNGRKRFLPFLDGNIHFCDRQTDRQLLLYINHNDDDDHHNQHPECWYHVQSLASTGSSWHGHCHHILCEDDDHLYPELICQLLVQLLSMMMIVPPLPSLNLSSFALFLKIRCLDCVSSASPQPNLGCVWLSADPLAHPCTGRGLFWAVCTSQILQLTSQKWVGESD